MTNTLKIQNKFRCCFWKDKLFRVMKGERTVIFLPYKRYMALHFSCRVVVTFFCKPGVKFLSGFSEDARMTYYLSILLICVLSFLDLTSASSGEVMGCGGFVKSSKSNIDLSRIQISLYEKRNNIQRYLQNSCFALKFRLVG